MLGIYLAQKAKKRVLLIDIDPQCSLSLALGLDPDKVSKTELTIYNLVIPDAWTKLKNKNLESYVQSLKSASLPKNLHIIPGSFDTDTLDYTIAKTLIEDEKRYTEQLFLYAKQLLMGFKEDYDYILVDCPPNKMFLTQAMLRACSYYLPVTIPDRISIYGMPRLIRWVCQIKPAGDRPKLLGYVLNAVNRIGGGMVGSQSRAKFNLLRDVQSSLQTDEKTILGTNPEAGSIPRLDVIARFLGEDKNALDEFSKTKSMQPTVDSCVSGLRDNVIARIQKYNGQ